VGRRHAAKRRRAYCFKVNTAMLKDNSGVALPSVLDRPPGN
jgi:hypothetical protein